MKNDVRPIGLPLLSQGGEAVDPENLFVVFVVRKILAIKTTI